MKKIYLSLFFLLIVQLHSITIETASFENFLYGNAEDCGYDNWISHVSEGIALNEFNLYAPYDIQTNGFGDFYIYPDSQLNAWEMVVTYFLYGDFIYAEQLIEAYSFPYEIIQFEDTTTSRTYYLLREILNYDYFDDNLNFDRPDEHGSFDYGWGLYIYNPEATQPAVITVPHPNDDFITPALGYKCFKQLDAKFLLISGAGREVKWTEEGEYNNSKSLSDPTRVANHPFNTFYRKACNHIRGEFAQRELSIQIHSYDWNRHLNTADCQISSGDEFPTSPIYDVSNDKNDIVNNSEWMIHPANTIGEHAEVLLNNFYAVYTYHNNPLYYLSFDDCFLHLYNLLLHLMN